MFSKQELAARKQAAGLTQQEAANYVANSHALTAVDVRSLRKAIAGWRKIYEDRYRDVRNQVFAHKALSSVDEANQVFGKTSIDEMKSLFAFLSALYSALWECFHNGRRSSLSVPQFVLPPVPGASGRDMLPGELVYREGHAVLKSIVRGREDEE